MSKRGANKVEVLEDVDDIDNVAPVVKMPTLAQNLPVFYSPMKPITNDKI